MQYAFVSVYFVQSKLFCTKHNTLVELVIHLFVVSTLHYEFVLAFLIDKLPRGITLENKKGRKGGKDIYVVLLGSHHKQVR